VGKVPGSNDGQEHSMAWLHLAVAGACEIIWAIGLKYTEGVTRLACIGLILAGIVGLKLVTPA
jgi:quaternary ammonium compound-resistance protein SugE